MLKILNSQLRPTGETGTKYNDGVIAGMSEMFLQSHEDFIELLPALPDAWKDGEIKGLVARGGFDLNMEWKDGKLNGGHISSKKGGSCIVKYKDKTLSLKLAPQQSVSLANKF
jgi:alpha-L-fucosidase 2